MSDSEPPRIWALLGARAGDNDQVIALAQALGLPFEVKHLSFNRLRHLGPRLLGRSLASLTRDCRRSVLAVPPPDLTISTGHRSVPLVRALRRRSAGVSRSIHLGFPRVSATHFDLVVTTPQYSLPDEPNVIALPFALTRNAVSEDSALDPELSALPEPRRLLVVGGPNIYWKIDQPVLFGTLARMIEEAERDGGSVVVTTSPRTPPEIEPQMVDRLGRTTVPTLIARPGHPPAYASLLATASSVRVTADSVAMVSDAIWTGKPMALVPVTPNAFGAVVMGLMDRLRPGRPVYPQDLRFFWRTIGTFGVSDKLAQPLASAERQLHDLIERVRAIALQRTGLKGKNGGRGKD